MCGHDKLTSNLDLPEILARIRAQTPARLLQGRSGAAYRTVTHLELRAAHAAARDAVQAELSMFPESGEEFARKWNLFEVRTQASSKEEYLMRPDLGRRFNETSRAEIIRRCSSHPDVQIVIGDGLSVTAVARQVPLLLPLLREGAKARGLSTGSTFVVRYCRVGILNEIGELLKPQVVVLLIGERPGLATAESLSAYLAHRPKANDTDAQRNLVSNIHRRGVNTSDAAERILRLAEAMMRENVSGCGLREDLPSTLK